MEFKFRAVDDRTTPFLSSSTSSPSLSYFSEQALRLRANYTTAPNFMLPNPRDFYTIQHEIEERIRQGVIAENVRQRLLEEEVRILRRELMEREMAMQGASRTGLSIDERLTTELYSRYPLMHHLNNHWLENPLAFPGNHNLGFGHNVQPPILPQFSDAAKDELRSALEFTQKDKLIMLAKPDPNLCIAKRKATTPAAGSHELSLTSLKKPKEWSCALCQVSATCERGLNEHLQGKRHKAKEAGLLRAQKMCSNNSASRAEKSGKRIKLAVSQDGAGLETQTKEKGKSSLQVDKTLIVSDQKMEGIEDPKNIIEEPLEQKNLNVENQKKNLMLTESVKRKQSHKKKYKFWCENCQVGTHAAVVMEAHKKGKKHIARVKEANQNGEAISTAISTMIVASLEPSEKAKDIDVVVKEANEATTENVPTENAEDTDALPKEANEETAENVTRDLDDTYSPTVADAVDVKNQIP